MGSWVSRGRNNVEVSPPQYTFYQDHTNNESDQVSIAMPLLENTTVNCVQKPEGPLDPVVEEKLKQLFSMISTENEPSEEFNNLLQSAPVPEVSQGP